jgi:pentatricopeptide repeat protein
MLLKRMHSFALETSKPMKRAAGDACARSFSQVARLQRQRQHRPIIHVHAKRPISSVSTSSLKTLPDDVISFLDELASYETGAATIGNERLKECIKKYPDDTDTCIMLLQKSLHFEEQYPECRGIVDGDCFLDVIQTCVFRDEVEEADELLTVCQSIAHIQPHPRCFETIIDGYAKRRKPEALQRIEAMIKELEEDRCPASVLETTPLNCNIYNILMRAYIGVLEKKSIIPIRQTMKRMNEIAARKKRDNVRPNLACYTTLMRAIILGGKAGFAFEITAVLEQLKADTDYLKQPLTERMYLESLAIYAWSKSEDQHAPTRARKIFDAMEKPTAEAYNSLCCTYAAVGDIDNVFHLFEKMQTDAEYGRNEFLGLNLPTSTAVMKALQKSKRTDAAEKAERIFASMPMPKTLFYNTLLDIYAQKGDDMNAFNLMNRMKLDFEFGKNKYCEPNSHTYATVLHSLHKSKRSDTIEKAEQLFNSIPSPNTVTYNTLFNIYAGNGETEKALDKLDRMQTDYRAGTNKNCRPTMYTYSTILNALYKSNRADAAERAEQIFNDISLPDTFTYNTLLNIHAQKGDTEKAMNLVHQMLSDFDAGKNTQCCPNEHTYATILKALQNSDRSDATEIATQIVRRISAPGTVAYNTLLHMNARNGETETTLGILARMRFDVVSGRNRNCRPDMHTYATVLNALQKSNCAEAVDKAKQIFNTIPSPNVVVYNTLLNIYAARGMGNDAIVLTRGMQSDFDSGKNRNCMPNSVTERTLLKSFRVAKDSALKHEAQDILKWFRKRLPEN